MKNILLLIVSLSLLACSSTTSSVKAPEPEPSLEIAEFCESFIHSICVKAQECGMVSYDSCKQDFAQNIVGCNEWTEELLCGEGFTYDGTGSYKCVVAMEVSSCEIFVESATGSEIAVERLICSECLEKVNGSTPRTEDKIKEINYFVKPVRRRVDSPQDDGDQKEKESGKYGTATD